MRMKHHGHGLVDRPNARLLGCPATVSPAAVRERFASELPIISPQQPVHDRGEDQ
jgi:hypothetical protein